MTSFISKSEALVCSHEALLLVSEKFEHTNWCCVVQLLNMSVKPTNNRG